MNRFVGAKDARKMQGFVRCERYRLSYAKFAAANYQVKKLEGEKEILEIMRARTQNRLKVRRLNRKSVRNLKKNLMKLEYDISEKEKEIEQAEVIRDEYEQRSNAAAVQIRQHEDLVIITEYDFDASVRADFMGELKAVRSAVLDSQALLHKLTARGYFSFLKVRD